PIPVWSRSGRAGARFASGGSGAGSTSVADSPAAGNTVTGGTVAGDIVAGDIGAGDIVAGEDACPVRRSRMASVTSLAGAPSLGSTALLVSIFSDASSFIVRLLWKTVSSVTGKIVISVPVASAV